MELPPKKTLSVFVAAISVAIILCWRLWSNKNYVHTSLTSENSAAPTFQVPMVVNSPAKPSASVTVVSPGTTTAPVMKFHYRVEGIVPLLKQEKKKGCWATATAMLFGWKLHGTPSVDEVMVAIGPEWSAIYRDGDSRGLRKNEKEAFLKAAQLHFEWGASYAVEGLQKLLMTHGPLWFTVNDDTFNTHATVVIGVSGSGSMSDTYVIYVDPEDGLEHQKLYAEFMKWYEDVAVQENRDFAGDITATYAVQVVHF